jgi:hypothetical protein
MLVTSDGRPALLDFGITGRFSDEARTALMKLMLGGLTQDPVEQVRAFRDLGGFAPEADAVAIAAQLDVERLRAMQAELAPEQMADQMKELLNQLLDLGARLPKALFLYLKGMIYLNGAISALAADVNILASLGDVFSYFSTTHGDIFANQFGVDLGTIDFDSTMRSQLEADLGVTTNGTISYREVSELQAQRRRQMRRSR